jgi:membrane protein implicated in regulation of membrane protease activity
MWGFMSQRLLFLILALLLLALVAAGQAITFAWLSSFPERASQFASLEIKFWRYTIVAVVLVLIDLVLLVRLIGQIKNKRSNSSAANKE